MDVRGRSIALFGRFAQGARERLAREIEAAGGAVARDLTRRSDALVIGSHASTLVDSGALAARLESARARGVPVLGERAFHSALAGAPPEPPPTLPLATACSGTRLGPIEVETLAAFDLIVTEGGACRFGDARTIRTAHDLLGQGCTLGETVRILAQARDLSPPGRHGIVVTASGQAALQWPDGRTTLDGQGVLPLDDGHASLEDLFEAAEIAEADGESDEAARLYDLCARADRRDPIAPYNYGNIRLAQGAHPKAILAYQQALARDPRFAEARYNLAQALEAVGKLDAAAAELDRLLLADPEHADAVFNLAQLRMKAGDPRAAKALYQRYLALDPPAEWAETARKAVLYCEAGLRA